MDEDVLSDVVPSNIVSRQVCNRHPWYIQLCVQSCYVQPSQGMEVESEYDEEPMEEDELVSEEEQEVQTFSVSCRTS